MMKKIFILLVCCLSILVILNGCEKKDAKYFNEIIKEKSGEKIKQIVVDDFDDDGEKEAFAYVTKSLKNKEGKVQLWFANQDGCELLDKGELSQINSNSFIKYNQYIICNLARNNNKYPVRTRIYYVKNKTVFECNNKINNIKKIGKKIFELDTSYCHYNHQLKRWMSTSEQYYHLKLNENSVERVEGKVIKQKDFYNYKNSKRIIKQIKSTLVKNHSIKSILFTFVLRKDNTIDINVLVKTTEKDKYKYHSTVNINNNSLKATDGLMEGNKEIETSEERVDNCEYIKVENFEAKGKTYYKYTVYDKKGKRFYNDNLFKDPIIEKCSDDVYCVRWGTGTGVWQSRFFDINKKKHSEIFDNNYDFNNNRTILYDVKEKCVEVQDVFDEDNFYCDFGIKTSDSPQPVIDAKYIDDERIEVKYFTGKDFKEVSKIFNLNKKVDVSIKQVNSSYIKMSLKNLSIKRMAYYRPAFTLYKYKNKKWKKVKFLPGKDFFALTSTLAKNEKRTITIKWKKYFGKNISKGKYKIKYIEKKKFCIK